MTADQDAERIEQPPAAGVFMLGFLRPLLAVVLMALFLALALAPVMLA